MKKMYKIITAILLTASIANAASAQVTVQTVKDSISSDTRWTCDKQYLLKGYVYVVLFVFKLFSLVILSLVSLIIEVKEIKKLIKEKKKLKKNNCYLTIHCLLLRQVIIK